MSFSPTTFRPLATGGFGAQGNWRGALSVPSTADSYPTVDPQALGSAWRGQVGTVVYRSDGVRQNNFIFGVTRDSSGAVLGSCRVELYLTGLDLPVATLTSDATGNFAFSNPGSGPFYIVAYKAGSPDVAGTTVNTLVSNGVSPPICVILPVVSGSLAVGQVLSTTTGTWTNSPSAYAYQWNRSGTPIGGATSSTYTPVSADDSQALSCTVTAINAGGSQAVTSLSTALISSLLLTLTSALDGRVTFTRASSGTDVNSSGVIATASTDAPRFDYDPVTLAAKGLLIEEARTNSQTYSEQFDNGAWAKFNSSVSANAAISPDGNTTADSLTGTGGTATHGVQGNASLGGAGGVISVFAKAGTHNLIQIMVDTDVAPVANYDLTSGIAYSTGSNQTASIVSYGNGWYRCILQTNSATATTANVVLVSSTASGRYESNSISGYVYLWGWGMEIGAAFPTSYIPTTSATVTRAADIAQMTGSNFSSWWNASAGTFVVASNTASQNCHIINASDGTSSNRLVIYGDSQQHMYATAAGINSVDSGVGTPSFVNDNKTALAFAANDFSCSLNGAAVVTDATAAVPAATKLGIGTSEAANDKFLNGHIKSLTYYASRLSNATLQSLTT